MKRTQLLQEVRKMRFMEAYEGWNEGRLSQAEAALMLGVCARSFRRYLSRYEEEGEAGLMGRRLARSNRSALVDEVLALQDKYRSRFSGWNVRHFFSWYQRDSGTQRGQRRTWGGRADVRTALYMATLSAVRSQRRPQTQHSMEPEHLPSAN